MNGEGKDLFTDLELDALRETMNMSFGSASADLADVMDIFIRLNIPEIQVVSGNDLISLLSRDMVDFDTSSIVQQEYYGDFPGRILLIFPWGIEKELLSYFQHPDTTSFQSDELVDLEKEVLLEIGNLLIGACVGRFFDFIGSRITYQPPQCLLGRKFRTLCREDTENQEGPFVSISTHFAFEDRRVAGHLFLISKADSAEHLKKALRNFLENKS